MDDDMKKQMIHEVNIKIGKDINELSNAYELEKSLLRKRHRIQSCLNEANNEVPTKLSAAIKKAEQNSKHIEELKNRSESLKKKVNDFMQRTEPLRSKLNVRFGAIQKLEETLVYLQSYEKIADLSQQLKQCNNDEQAVLLYAEFKKLCTVYQKGHRAAYVKEYTHYWHDILKDRFTKNYEDLLNKLKWPSQSLEEISPAPKEILVKFGNLTKYLLLIQEPEDLISSNITENCPQDKYPCLPVKILLRPIKMRFTFHFTGSRQTARIDRPEWFLSQTLKWIKMHHSFVRTQIQPVADKLQMKGVEAVDEFIAGVVALAAERLHTILGLYNTQTSKGDKVDMDAAFAHAVDETLGFHKELSALTGSNANSVLSVLTRAETFVRWLIVEKKYALAKMDETLGNEQWSESVGCGVVVAVGAVVWVPKGADWFIALLRTIEERYAALPQPGHRLQFLELQLDLVEEWRVRLSQIMHEAIASMLADNFLTADSPRQLAAVINAAHHMRTVLLQWAHSLHYLQLHYYRRQFQHFTKQHHAHDEDNDDNITIDLDVFNPKTEADREAVTLRVVEQKAEKLALYEASRQESTTSDRVLLDIPSPLNTGRNLEETEEAGVFAEAPALLAHLRDAGLAALSDQILLQFKAHARDYKNTKWHAMALVESLALCVSPALCRPLSALCMCVTRAAQWLAPAMAHRLRAHLALSLDAYVFEEVILEHWFNTGGTIQFTHDVKRNLIPAFAPPNKTVSQINLLPKVEDACKLLNLDYDVAQRLRCSLNKRPVHSEQLLAELDVNHIAPREALHILSHRTDLLDMVATTPLRDLF